MLVFAAAIALLVARLWSLQIDQFEKYSQMLPGSSEVSVRLPGVRGEIKDRNGVTLVTNEPSFEVLFDLPEIIKGYKMQHETLPEVEYVVRDRNGIRQVRSETDVVKIVVDFIIPELENLRLAAGFNADALQIHFRSTRGVVPWAYRDDLTFEEFATFAERNLGLPGVSVSVRPKRRYVYGSLAAHVLGYVKEPDIQKVPLEERRKFNFYVADQFGATGIEKSLDSDLRGRSGKRILLKDEKGRIVSEVRNEPAQKGRDVFLTLDAQIQLITETALREGGVGRGAAVVIEPSSGDILGLASVPNYDPNNFIPSISQNDWDRYRTDLTTPFINRALRDYVPGSTFKIASGLAGLYAGLGNRTLLCNGGQQYGKKFMKCWIHSKGRTHGWITLDQALMHSCNDYFYQYGNMTGIAKMKTVANILGVGIKPSIPLDQNPGLMADAQWKQQTFGQPWTQSDSARSSIGQGFVEATPLQMASVAATIANHGVRHPVNLIHGLGIDEGTMEEHEPPSSIDLREEGLKASQIEIVRKGMWRVVNDKKGTARRAKSEPWETAGKTGTAQETRKGGIKDNRVWFISFAPYDKPEFAVCTMVGNGKSGGGVAAPIAARILRECMAMKLGFRRELTALAEIPGNFDPIESVEYEDDPAGIYFDPPEEETAQDLAGGDGESAEDLPATSAPASTARAPIPAAPNVRAEATEIPRALPVLKPAVQFKLREDGSRSRSPDRR